MDAENKTNKLGVLHTHCTRGNNVLPVSFVIPCATMCFDWQVLQKLGKADETKDAAFEEGVINFNKQYVSTAPSLG